jgi:hypothetical protein
MLDGPWLDLQVYPAARHAVLTQALGVLARVPAFRSMRQRPGVYRAPCTRAAPGEWLFDVFLSVPEVRDRAYAAVGEWLDQHSEIAA